MAGGFGAPEPAQQSVPIQLKLSRNAGGGGGGEGVTNGKVAQGLLCPAGLDAQSVAVYEEPALKPPMLQLTPYGVVLGEAVVGHPVDFPSLSDHVQAVTLPLFGLTVPLHEAVV